MVNATAAANKITKLPVVPTTLTKKPAPAKKGAGAKVPAVAGANLTKHSLTNKISTAGGRSPSANASTSGHTQSSGDAKSKKSPVQTEPLSFTQSPTKVIPSTDGDDKMVTDILNG